MVSVVPPAMLPLLPPLDARANRSIAVLTRPCDRSPPADKQTNDKQEPMTVTNETLHQQAEPNWTLTGQQSHVAVLLPN